MVFRGYVTMDYVHQILNEDIQSISGTYTPLKELYIKHNGREILCIIGNAVVDTACCGSGNFAYATIPGYIVGLKEKTNEAGLPVSRIEPLEEASRREIAQIIKKEEGIQNINFW